jgi:hypothetical protein
LTTIGIFDTGLLIVKLELACFVMFANSNEFHAVINCNVYAINFQAVSNIRLRRKKIVVVMVFVFW